jgi:sec-independent protein translocase protein TatB
VLGILNSLGGGEVIVILVLALIVLGPEKLPDAIRKVGNIYGELRRMSEGFQSEFREAFEEPMRELEGTARAVQDAIQQPLQAASTSLTASPQVEAVEESQAPVGDVLADSQAPVEDVVAESQAPVEDVLADSQTPPDVLAGSQTPPDEGVSVDAEPELPETDDRVTD